MIKQQVNSIFTKYELPVTSTIDEKYKETRNIN